MSEDDKTRKRNLSSPDTVVQDKDKVRRDASPVPHLSCMALADNTTPAVDSAATPPAGERSTGGITGTPVSANKTISPSKLDLLSECAKANINPQVVINVPLLYQMVVNLEMRLYASEKALTDSNAKHEMEILGLQLEIDTLKDKAKAVPTFKKEDADYLDTNRREFPLLSASVGSIEAAVDAMKLDITHLFADSDTLNHEMEEKINSINDKLDNGNLAVPGAVVGEGGRGTNQTRQVDLVAMDKELRSLGEEMNNVNNRAKQHRRRAHLLGDQRDQYSRKELLRITGVPFVRGENTNQVVIGIANRLGVHVTDADISVSHRSGRRGGSTPRPILCKFVRRDIKNHILANKKYARDIRTDPDGNPVRIFVDEALTKMRASVCKKLRSDRIDHYTRDGKLYIAAPNSETEFKIYDTPEDWMQLQWLDSVKSDVGIYPRD